MADSDELVLRIAAVQARIDRACARVDRDPSTVELLAVTKTRDDSTLRAAAAAGLVTFGENRIQELVRKAADLTDLDVRWHMIGNVQTNKVKDLVSIERLELLHSLDRGKLADALQERLPEGHVLDVLLELHVTDEATKHGVRPGEDALALARHVAAACPRLRLRGVMAMGPRDGDPAPAFATAQRTRLELEQTLGASLPVASLGMSGDFEAAIEAGSTLIRLGTSLFGPRA